MNINKALLFFFILLSIKLNAQYTGGNGDGYDSVEETIILSGLYQASESFKCYPTILPAGGLLNFEKPISGLFKLIGPTGISWDLGTFDKVNKVLIPNNITEGVYLLLIKGKNEVFKTTVAVHH